MTGFSLRDLIKPGEGAKIAMGRELSTRVIKEAAEAVKPGWRYSGPADMLKQHGQAFRGDVTPEPYRGLYGTVRECHNNALLACEAAPELRYFTGLYTVGRDVCEHSWCMTPGGTVVEVTYPTFGIAGGTRVNNPDGSLADVGWMPPEFWSYVGLEFDPAFVRAVIERYGIWWPITEVTNPFAGDLYSTPYTPSGFQVAP